MKYFLKVIIALAVAASVIFGYSIYYRDKKNDEKVVLTTAAITTTKPGETKKDVQRLVIENEEADFHLFAYGDDLIVRYQGLETTLEKVAWGIDKGDPQIFYKDYDGDGEKEVLLYIVGGLSNVVEGQSNMYHLRLFKIVKDAEGKDSIQIIFGHQNTWKVPLENAIRCEVSQLKSCPKFLQFAMDDASKNIKYDEKTGISSNKYVFYAQTIKRVNTFLTFDRWGKGDGFYHLDDKGNISLSVQILAFYKEETQAHYIGDIKSDIIIRDGKFDLKPNSIHFEANEENAVTDPRDTAEEDWTSLIKNSAGPGTSTDNKIDWIETDFSLEREFEQINQSFANKESQIKCVDTVEFTPDKIIMTAKTGFTFVPYYIDKGEYSAMIKDEKDREIDISLSCEIKNENTLIIHLDKRYKREDLKNIIVKYGI